MSPEPAGGPPPFEIVNPEGGAELLLVCDHASRALPASYGTLGLDGAELWRHIAWDIGAADVTRRLSALLDAPAVLAGYSRLLIDCNRALDDPTLFCQISDGTVVPANRAIDAAERARRLQLCYEPYHAAIDAALDRLQRRIPVPAFISIHSFTPVMKGFERPWHVGILWDQDPRIPAPLMRALAEDATLVVGDNEPYSGRAHVGHTTARHAGARGLPHVLIEIRQDLIDTHHGAEAWANRLADALRRVLAAASPFRVERFAS